MRQLLAIALLAVLAAVSLDRNALWRDDGLLWTDSLRKSPGKARGYNEYGLHLLAAGRHLDAYRVLSRSLELNAYQYEVVINLGIALERLGQVREAISAYERAQWISPGDPTAYYNLGVFHYKTLRDHDTALSYFLRARELDPREPDVHEFLWRIYAERGEHDAAEEERSRHLRLQR